MTLLKVKKSPQFEMQIRAWARCDAKIFRKIIRMMEEIVKNPGFGIGMPKQLSGGEKYWSRRINQRHRLIYKVDKGCVEFLFCSGHYENL
jgi:toxin YoeB